MARPSSSATTSATTACGYGPYKLTIKLTRHGEKIHLDFSADAAQAVGPINYFINENLVRMFFGIYVITIADPQILWNDGFYPLIDVTIPEDSFWKPRLPGRAQRSQPRYRPGLRPVRRATGPGKPGDPQCRGVLLVATLHVFRSLRRWFAGWRVVPALLHRFRRDSGPPDRRRTRTGTRCGRRS